MFDYRYHAISLAAVLLALAVGVLIGVAIGDSNLVSSAKSGVVRDLRAEVDGANHRAEELRGQIAASKAVQEDLYPIAVHGLLRGRTVGLVFLGGASDPIDGFAREAVTQAGGDLATVLAVREPLDTAGLAREASGTRYAALGSEPGLMEKFGFRIAVELVNGGPFLGHVQNRLFSAFDGQLQRLDGVVLVRGEPSGWSSEAEHLAGEFEAGLLRGLNAKGVETVGAEVSSSEPSQVPWFKSHGLPSVDDLDAIAGRAALAFALTGARGAYGSKPTADALMPRVGAR
ncbi:MAG TPA: copper transporter [Solirubrobacteraceae bacterium]|nr:copper transporter [Solirubrobacteraceae bacterium]